MYIQIYQYFTKVHVCLSCQQCALEMGVHILKPHHCFPQVSHERINNSILHNHIEPHKQDLQSIAHKWINVTTSMW